MPGFEILLLLTLGLVGLGVAERWRHQRNLNRIPVRVHVNGTRGKSSVVRLIAAGLRAGGQVVCAKTTGTLARMILPDGREVPVFRPSRANVIEQIRIVEAAAAYQAEVLIIECMALQPYLQWLSESKFVRATHGVITNARPDHLDVMGPDPDDVAKALAGMVPTGGGPLYTCEQNLLPTLEAAAQDRGAELVVLDPEAVATISEADLAGFPYKEHPDNLALALKVCTDLGVDRQVALEGMWAAKPDPGAMTLDEVEFFGRRLLFYNAFAANDPESTLMLWEQALARHAEAHVCITLFNCRADRADRSRQLGEAVATWPTPDKVVLMGTGTYIFARAAVARGLDPDRLVFAEEMRIDEIFETVVALTPGVALVMGMGNIGGQGLDLVKFFHNRAIFEPPPPRQALPDGVAR